MDLLIVDNGIMQITLVPTRGMGIYDVKSGNMRLGWESPVKEIVNPAYIDLESRNGLGWLMVSTKCWFAVVMNGQVTLVLMMMVS